MKRNKEIPVVLVVLFLVSTAGVVDGANLITNSGFESGKTSWTFFTNGTGTFTTPSPGFEGNNSAKLTLSSGGTNIQLFQTGVTLEANTRYRLSFAAYSNTGHDMSVRLIMHDAPYTSYMPDFTVNLGTGWQTFTTEFNSKGFSGTVDDGRLMFWLTQYAAAGDAYYIDAIKLEKSEIPPPVDERVAMLESKVAALEKLLSNVTRNGSDIYIDGANLHIRDGSGDTEGQVNGLGNLIVGYNEPRQGCGKMICDNRTGSHNMIVGSMNDYMSYGGLVVGQGNEISGKYASVSGGSWNAARGWYSSVSGGSINYAIGFYSSISGGGDNIASGHESSVSGGQHNEANNTRSSVQGGSGNIAKGPYSSVSGGGFNVANEWQSSVSGGYQRNATGIYDWVAGGLFQDQ